MRAYKFLRTGAIGPFSLAAWPPARDGAPGGWIVACAPPRGCATGVHACRAADLPLWLSDELWEVELRGPVVEEPSKLVATAGRLLARVEAWDREAATLYADACAMRARDRALGRAAAGGDGASPPEDTSGRGDPARGAMAYAADAAVYAEAAREHPGTTVRNAACTAMIAVQAAIRADGPLAAPVERAWQAAWLARHLGLRDA